MKHNKIVLKLKDFDIYIMVCEENNLVPSWETLIKFLSVYTKL